MVNESFTKKKQPTVWNGKPLSLKSFKEIDNRLIITVEGVDRPIKFKKKKYDTATISFGLLKYNNLTVWVNDITLRSRNAVTSSKCSGLETDRSVLMIDSHHLKLDYRHLVIFFPINKVNCHNPKPPGYRQRHQ
jgi:hypothetical protein